MKQPAVRTAADYHRLTSYQRHALTPHTLDWAHQPRPIKDYGQLDRVALDRDPSLPAIDYMDVARQTSTMERRGRAPLNVQTLSTACRLTHAVTARSAHAGRPFYYRSVASAGALYPFELYLGVQRIDGLDPGLYHHDPFQCALTVLRQGWVPETPPLDNRAAATFFITGIFFRSAWKYRSRAYRYVLLDAGHLLENLRMALQALEIPFSIHLDFDDDRTGTLLGLDPQREVCLACVHLIDSGGPTNGKTDAAGLRPLSEAICRASQVSSSETEYAEILQLHRAGAAVINPSHGRTKALDGFGRQPRCWQAVGLCGHADGVDYTDVLWRRRSRRNFVTGTLLQNQLMAFLEPVLFAAATPSIRPFTHSEVLTTGFLAGPGLPVAPGLYLVDVHGQRIGQVASGRLIEPMAAACLDQMWLKNSALHLLFMTDLVRLEHNWGPRGYRYAMIAAGRLGQQVYLSATASGLGACGIGAIYDQEAAALLGLETDGVLLYLVAVGSVKL